MSRIYDNKRYAPAGAYHTLNINGIPPTGQNSRNDGTVLIHVIRDDTLYEDTHLKSVVISPTVKDGKLVNHYVARDGKYTHYESKNVQSSIKFNEASLDKNAVTIQVAPYIRATFSSKLTTGEVAEVSETPAGPSQVWFG